MQLLKISTTPIQYEMKVQNARLEIHQNFVPQPEASSSFVRLNLQSQNIQVQLDSYEMRKGFNMKNNTDLAKESAQKGIENIQELTRDYVETGKQLGQIQDGIKIGDIVRQKTMEQPKMYTAYFPCAAPEISWIPNELQVNYVPSELDYSFKELHNALNYIPGSVRLNILQYPEVNIEYIGKPNYVPPSAAPDYKQKVG